MGRTCSEVIQGCFQGCSFSCWHSRGCMPSQSMRRIDLYLIYLNQKLLQPLQLPQQQQLLLLLLLQQQQLMTTSLKILVSGYLGVDTPQLPQQQPQLPQQQPQLPLQQLKKTTSLKILVSGYLVVKTLQLPHLPQQQLQPQRRTTSWITSVNGYLEVMKPQLLQQQRQVRIS